MRQRLQTTNKAAVWIVSTQTVTQCDDLTYAQYCRVESRRRRRREQNSQLAHDDCRRIPNGRQLGNWPNRLHSGLAAWILIDIDNLSNNDVIIICRHLSPTNGNCKLGDDCRRMRSHRRRDSTRQLSRVGGVYWVLDNVIHFCIDLLPSYRRSGGWKVVHKAHDNAPVARLARSQKLHSAQMLKIRAKIQENRTYFWRTDNKHNERTNEPTNQLVCSQYLRTEVIIHPSYWFNFILSVICGIHVRGN